MSPHHIYLAPNGNPIKLCICFRAQTLVLRLFSSACPIELKDDRMCSLWWLVPGFDGTVVDLTQSGGKCRGVQNTSGQGCHAHHHTLAGTQDCGRGRGGSLSGLSEGDGGCAVAGDRGCRRPMSHRHCPGQSDPPVRCTPFSVSSTVK